MRPEPASGLLAGCFGASGGPDDEDPNGEHFMRKRCVSSSGRIAWAHNEKSTLFFEPDGDIPSHILLPFVEGTIDGEATTYDYPPRPFTPGGK